MFVWTTSQDPLLDWALRNSGCGLASLPEGSEAGLRRLYRGEVIAAFVVLRLARLYGDPRPWLPRPDALLDLKAHRASGERAALAAFQDAISGMLPPESRELIETQYAGIQQTHRRLDAFLTREVADS